MLAPMPPTRPDLPDESQVLNAYHRAIVAGDLLVVLPGASGPRKLSDILAGITGSTVTYQQVIDALGFTPYSAANPAGYQTAAQVQAAIAAALGTGPGPVVPAGALLFRNGSALLLRSGDPLLFR